MVANTIQTKSIAEKIKVSGEPLAPRFSAATAKKPLQTAHNHGLLTFVVCEKFTCAYLKFQSTLESIYLRLFTNIV